jgi:hypothetical protein
MLSAILKKIKSSNYGSIDIVKPEKTLGDDSEINNDFIPNMMDDAQEQEVNLVQENRLDRGLIETVPDLETLDLKDYIDRADFKENLKNGNLNNDLDENYDDTVTGDLNQTALENYAKDSSHNDINFKFENFYKH